MFVVTCKFRGPQLQGKRLAFAETYGMRVLMSVCLSSKGIHESGVDVRPRQESSQAVTASPQPCWCLPDLQADTEVLQRSSVYWNETETQIQLLYKLLSNRIQSLNKTRGIQNIRSKSLYRCGLLYFVCWPNSKNVMEANLPIILDTTARRGYSGEFH